MSKKYPGGYLTKTPPTVSQTSAPGIWTLEQAEYYQNAGQWPVAPDPNFKQVALLLHGDGTNGAQNNTFVDGSSNNFTITRTGNVAQGTFSPFSLAEGQWSNYFDGSGDYLTSPNDAATNITTGDWTAEAWVYCNSNTGPSMVMARRATGGTFGALSLLVYNGNPLLYCGNGSSFPVALTGSSTVTTNTWIHLAVVRNGNTFTLYQNGTSVATTTNATSLANDTSVFSVGACGNGDYPFSGYISNARLVKGSAVYTSNFTPPTSPLTAITNTSLLTCQSNRFKDNSSNNFTITRNGDTKVTAFSPFAPSAAYSASTNGGSGYFDGSGDYLYTADSSTYAYGTGDLTVECWFYPTAAPSNQVIIDQRETSPAGGGFSIECGSNLIPYLGTSVNFLAGTLAMNLNAWNHLCYVRSGTTLSLYVNGVRSATATNSTNLTSTRFTIAAYTGRASSYAFGYISNVRLVKGTAVYDPSQSTITVPTAPLTAVTNTQLLLNCTNAAIYDNAGKNDIETVGDAQISTSVKKYGTGSMYFDGTGDWLAIPSSTEFDVGGGDFTIECWVYASSTQPAYAGLVSRQGSGGVQIIMGSGGTTVEAWGNLPGGTRLAASTTTVTNSNWHHIALVRNGSLFKIYVDGVAGSTTLTSSSAFVAGAAPLYIGYDTGGSGRVFNGYIDDLRITKGVARYTANFVPPNGPFPNV